MDVNTSNVTTLIERLVTALREGVAIHWVDKRPEVIIALSVCLGVVLGAYLSSILTKRGKIAEIRKDLDQVVRLQEGILDCVSRQLWTDQDLANLKRETYQKLNRMLHHLSSELSSILQDGVVPNGGATSNSDSESTLPGRTGIERQLDEFADLTIPARIALSEESAEIVMHFQSEFEKLKQLTGDVATYGFFVELRALVDDTRKQLIESARIDLREVAPSHKTRRAIS